MYPSCIATVFYNDHEFRTFYESIRKFHANIPIYVAGSLSNEYNNVYQQNCDKDQIIKYALENEDDMYYCESDSIFIGPLPEIDRKYSMAVVSNALNDAYSEIYGRYNGGILWINKNFDEFKVIELPIIYHFCWWNVYFGEHDVKSSDAVCIRLDRNSDSYMSKKFKKDVIEKFELEYVEIDK